MRGIQDTDRQDTDVLLRAGSKEKQDVGLSASKLNKISNPKFKSNVCNTPTKSIIQSIDCCIKEGCRFGRDMEVDKLGASCIDQSDL
mmetsp:Transcript_26513/g.58119  ORF Transcript_26513/g.58119 Transcript_26513/m.58119 type:complete len:87 (+) Transcript_26513:199-459(+)